MADRGVSRVLLLLLLYRSMSQKKLRYRPPSKVRILNLTYLVKFVGETERVAAEADGWCDSSNQTICIYKDLPDQAKADVFLHECIHALGNVLGVDWGKEEQVAHRIATGLCTMWKDNKTAYKWWVNLL